MSNRQRKPLPLIGLFFVIGLFCVAATETYSRRIADVPPSPAHGAVARTAPLAPFYLKESIKTFTSADPVTKNSRQSVKDLFRKEWNKVAGQIPRDTATTLDTSIRHELTAVRKSLWNLRGDCVLGELPTTKRKDLENFTRLTQAGMNTIQNDCLRAMSLYNSPTDRAAIESYAHAAYMNFTAAPNEDYNLMALDELEKSYLSFLYLAITEPYKQKKNDYFFIVGFVGLKLWSFNKDDAAMLPLLALSAEDVSSNEGMSAWLLLKDHIQFSNSGSAGERVPFYWNAILYTVGKK